MTAHHDPGVSGDTRRAARTRTTPRRPRGTLRPRTTPRPRTGHRLRALVAVLLPAALVAAGCGSAGGATDGSGGSGSGDRQELVIGAIPDQDHEKLQAIYGGLARYLSDTLDVPVRYRPVTDYTAAVSQFRTGDLDLVWFGGLTGVQAAEQTPGARPLVQRDIDARFHSVFLAHRDADVGTVQSPDDLRALAGTRFTFGSNSSTSGYLMPAYFLLQGGVDAETGFAGQPGFSGSHDKTIDLVESGTYEAGAANAQVWQSRLDEGTVDRSTVRVVWRTPAYHDYHWVLGPTATDKFGEGFGDEVTRAFLSLSPDDARGERLLRLFGCESFVRTDEDNYTQIAQVGRELGLLSPS